MLFDSVLAATIRYSPLDNETPVSWEGAKVMIWLSFPLKPIFK